MSSWPSFASNAFWTGIGGNCEAYNQGDPIVLYDEVADRWLVSQFAFPDSMGTFSQCVAISQTGDPDRRPTTATSSPSTASASTTTPNTGSSAIRSP